jgi:hypothetical protein
MGEDPSSQGGQGGPVPRDGGCLLPTLVRWEPKRLKREGRQELMISLDGAGDWREGRLLNVCY